MKENSKYTFIEYASVIICIGLIVYGVLRAIFSFDR